MKLPEISYSVIHSTEVPDGFAKHGMSNFNSDPYALRIKQPQTTQQKHSAQQAQANSDLQLVNVLSAPVNYKSGGFVVSAAQIDRSGSTHYNTASVQNFSDSTKKGIIMSPHSHPVNIK